MARAYWRADPPKARRMIERSVNQMARLGNKGEEATAAGFAALPFAAAVEFDRALAYADGGLALAQEIQNPLAEAAAYQYRGTLHDQRGEYARAIVDYESARRVAERASDLFRIYIVKFWESRAHTRTGDASRARTLAEEGLPRPFWPWARRRRRTASLRRPSPSVRRAAISGDAACGGLDADSILTAQFVCGIVPR